jgi:hypothetical protein
MTRLMNAFSNKAVNHAHMMSIYFMHYNFGVARGHEWLASSAAARCPS